MGFFNLFRKSSFFFNLLIVMLIKTIHSYELIYEKSYGSVSNCVDDLPNAWQKLTGGAISSCSVCTYSDGSSPSVAFITDQSSTTGLSFTYTASSLSQPFSILGVDIMYYQLSGSSVTLSLNGISSVTLSTLIAPTYENNKDIICPDTRKFYKGNHRVSITTLPSNQIVFSITKDSSSQSIGIRSIRLWTNCRQNCETCLDSTNCQVCISGFGRYLLSSGELVCEQTNSCTIANCYSCYKGNSIEICAKCIYGMKLNSSNVCVTISGLACPAWTYETYSSSCSSYTYGCMYQDKTTKSWTTCVNQENVILYKCAGDQMVMVYDRENYTVYQCGCQTINCGTCTSSTPCTTCATGFTYNSSTQVCQSTCSAGQYYSSSASTCSNCISNCTSCSNGVDCDTCSTGYTFDVASGTCSAPCSSGQYMNSGTCTACMTNCLVCSSGTTCTTCATGYTFNSTDVRCNLDCLSNQYFVTASNTCSTCMTNCLACTSGTTCTTCATGYTFSSSDVRCNLDCLSNQYFVTASNTCSNCITNCLTCTSGTTCSSCATGYTFSSADVRCNKDCLSNQYFVSASNTCSNCITNCLTCTSGTTCSTCATGYTFSSTDVRCNLNCLSNEYFITASNTCSTCMTNCLSCTSGSTCTTCASGYTFSSTDVRCNLNCLSNQYLVSASNTCSNCMANCQTCTSGTTCSTCATGYTFNSSDVRCNLNCLSNQYFITASNTCSNCMSNCLACTSSTTCTTCATGYTFSSTDVRCNLNCLSNQYFVIAFNTCSNCMSNCLTCSSSSTCSACATGYTFSSTDVRCNKNCLSNQYYVTASNTCSNCGTHCSNCSSTQCNTCVSSFFPSPSSLIDCIACQVSNCLSCSPDYQTCSTCQTGYLLSASSQCDVDPNAPPPPTPSQTQVTITLKSQDVVEDGYTLIIEFSSEVNIQYVNQSNFLTLSITNKSDFTYSVSSLTSKQITIKIVCSSNIKQQQISIRITDSSFKTLNNLQQDTINTDLDTFVLISADQRTISTAISNVGTGVSTAIISSVLPIVILSNFYILVNTIDITGFLYYLLFINIRQPENVLSFYGIFKDFQFPFIPNIFANVVDENYTQTSPPKFMEKQTDLYFLKNVGQSLTIWIIIIGIYTGAKILSFVRIPHLQAYLKRALDETWEWSSFLDMLWNTYIYALIGVLLQFRCYNFDENTYLANYILHTIVAIVTLLCPFIFFWMIYRQKDIKNNKKFNKQFSSLTSGLVLFDAPGSEPTVTSFNQLKREDNLPINDLQPDQQRQNMIFENKDDEIPISPPSEDKMKQNKISPQNNKDSIDLGKRKKSQSDSCESLIKLSIKQNKLTFRQKSQKKLSKYYNPILFFRKLLFGIIISYPTELVYFQISAAIFLNIMMIIYLILVMPYESKHENIKTLVGEFILIGICVAGFFLVQDDINEDEQNRMNIGWVIVGLSAFILLWHTTQLLIESCKSLFLLAVKILRKIFKSAKKVHPFSPESVKGSTDEYKVKVNTVEEIERVKGEENKSQLFQYKIKKTAFSKNDSELLQVNKPKVVDRENETTAFSQSEQHSSPQLHKIILIQNAKSSRFRNDSVPKEDVQLNESNHHDQSKMLSQNGVESPPQEEAENQIFKSEVNLKRHKRTRNPHSTRKSREQMESWSSLNQLKVNSEDNLNNQKVKLVTTGYLKEEEEDIKEI